MVKNILAERGIIKKKKSPRPSPKLKVFERIKEMDSTKKTIPIPSILIMCFIDMVILFTYLFQAPLRRDLYSQNHVHFPQILKVQQGIRP